jgi:hypothetical protein
MPKYGQPPKFSIGDRVAERPKDAFIPNVRAESRETVKKNRTQRYGTILNVLSKANKQGRVHHYYEVSWDNVSTKATHAQCRLCLVEDLAQLQESFFS